MYGPRYNYVEKEIVTMWRPVVYICSEEDPEEACKLEDLVAACTLISEASRR